MKHTHYSNFGTKIFEYSCQTLLHLCAVIWVVEVTNFVLGLHVNITTTESYGLSKCGFIPHM